MAEALGLGPNPSIQAPLYLYSYALLQFVDQFVVRCISLMVKNRLLFMIQQLASICSFCSKLNGDHRRFKMLEIVLWPLLLPLGQSFEAKTLLLSQKHRFSSFLVLLVFAALQQVNSLVLLCFRSSLSRSLPDFQYSFWKLSFLI